MRAPSKGVRVEDGGDVFATLRWGLRKYAWVVALFVVALAAVVPGALSRAPAEYEAQTQVGPTGEINLPNLDALPRLGTTVFNNGAVAEAVRQSVDPPLPESARVVPDRVDLVAAQDNIVFTVVGRGSTPDSAQHMANTAAAAFTEELNRYAASVGSFAIQRLADRPGQPVQSLSGPMTVAIGILAGLTAGVGTVALLLVLRRPVLDVGTAEEVAAAPVLGRVRVTSSQGGFEGLPRLARRIQMGAADMLLLSGPRNTRRARELLPRALSAVLGRKTTVVPAGLPGPDGDARADQEASAGATDLLILVGPTQAQIATRPESALTLLVVKEGISQAALRRQAEQSLDDGNCGVVLIRGQRGLRGWRRRSTQPASRSAAPHSASRLASDQGAVVWYARD